MADADMVYIPSHHSVGFDLSDEADRRGIWKRRAAVYWGGGCVGFERRFVFDV
jgi:hypothetical protein